MYTKEQEEIALREYERFCSVHAVIRRLGYLSKSTLYRWYERRNARLENRYSHTAEESKKPIINATQDRPRHPSAKLKHEVLRRCFELSADVEYVLGAIGYSRMSILFRSDQGW